MGLLAAAYRPELLIALAIAFVTAISVHEACHALAAAWLGDPTPKHQGRLTLNPLRHLDPIGTLLLVVAGFGWGKPVQVNPANLRYGMRRGMAIVSAAGPASNLATAAVLGPLFRQAASGARILPIGDDFLLLLVSLVIYVNVLLAVFNLIPIPPLDGFGVLFGIVGRELARQLEPLRRYGPLILLAVVLGGSFLGINILGPIISGPTRSLTGFLAGPELPLRLGL